MKKRTTNNIIIDLLQEAAESFRGSPKARPCSAEEMPIIVELSRAEKIDADVLDEGGVPTVSFSGIHLAGRQLLDEIVEKRDAKRWPARLRKGGWVAIGSIGTLILSALKTWIEQRLQK